jgi:hypothetical protein
MRVSDYIIQYLRDEYNIETINIMTINKEEIDSDILKFN